VIDLEWEPSQRPRTPSPCGRASAAGMPRTLPSGPIPCRYHVTGEERREYAAVVTAVLEEFRRNPRSATDDEVVRRPPCRDRRTRGTRGMGGRRASPNPQTVAALPR